MIGRGEFITLVAGAAKFTFVRLGEIATKP
jgi:hypothetical protein